MKKGKKQVQNKKPQQQSLFQEAWGNMMGDLDRFLPEKLRGGQGKKKFALWLFLLEVAVLGVIGKAVYEWLTN